MAKEKVIQISSTETKLFALTDKGSIFVKNLLSPGVWTELEEIENYRRKEDDKPKTS